MRDRLKDLKLLPSLFYLDKKTEREFQYAINERSKTNMVLICYIAVTILVFFIISSFFFSTHYRSGDNIQRLLIATLLAFIGFIQAKLNSKYLDVLWFYAAILISALMCSFFVSYALRHNELNEGGPMLTAILIMTIPMLHLGHKLIFWSLIYLGLIYIQLFSTIDITWTLYFYIFTVSVTAVLQRQIDLLLRKQYEHELIKKNKSQTDKLTGINNRYRFDNEIKDILSNLKDNQYLYLAMIDIDFFKKYNDHYGHLQGDYVLVRVSTLLSKQYSDMVVRFGGEEFILVMVSDEEKPHWLHDLPTQFKQLGIPHIDSEEGYVTVSTGIAMLDGRIKKNITKTQLLTLADECLYKAKRDGRNQVCSQQVS